MPPISIRFEEVAGKTHSIPALTQQMHGFCLSHLTFLLLHIRHDRRFRPALLACAGVGLVVLAFAVEGTWLDVGWFAMLLAIPQWMAPGVGGENGKAGMFGANPHNHALKRRFPGPRPRGCATCICGQ